MSSKFDALDLEGHAQMFQKDTIKRLKVAIQLADGSEIVGMLNAGLSGSIQSALNSDGNFIELRGQKNKPRFIAKSQIAMIEEAAEAAKLTPDLPPISRDTEFWQTVLKVGFDATPEMVKESYHRLAKRYHPDLYGDGLPEEVRNYANEMFTRINQAYDAFKAERVAA